MSGATRTFGPLHFEDLEPRRFEDLVRQLIYDFKIWRALEATGRAGSDDGFDARGFEIRDLSEVEPIEGEDEETPNAASSDRLWLIQCKREQKITPAKLLAHLEAIPDSSIDNLYGAIFVAACDFSKTARDKFREWCRAKGISEAHIWGKAELEDQLYQPKNDSLLFAYFGFSLQIRRRSAKTELRAKLAAKRKAERVVQHFQTILLRDPSDDHYPWIEGDKPVGWRVVQFQEHHPRGLLLLSKRYFAYLDDDEIHWDYMEISERAGVSPHEDPWRKSGYTSEDHLSYDRMQKYWSKLPNKNQANLYVFELIKYEDIIDIDEKGDAMAKMPHVYLENISSREEKGFVENLLRFNPVKIQAHGKTRTKFFPKEFPDIVESPDQSDKSRYPED